MQREKLVERIHDDIGPCFKQQFEALADHPLVGVANAIGLMGGLVLVKNKTTMEMFDPDLGIGMLCRKHLFGNGVIMRAVGDRLILAPPFVITHAQVDEMFALIRKCLDAAVEEIKANVRV